MRFSLPDEDAREKAAGEALPFRIDRFKGAALAVRPQTCSHVGTGPSAVTTLALPPLTVCCDTAQHRAVNRRSHVMSGDPNSAVAMHLR